MSKYRSDDTGDESPGQFLSWNGEIEERPCCKKQCAVRDSMLDGILSGDAKKVSQEMRLVDAGEAILKNKRTRR